MDQKDVLTLIAEKITSNKKEILEFQKRIGDSMRKYQESMAQISVSIKLASDAWHDSIMKSMQGPGFIKIQKILNTLKDFDDETAEEIAKSFDGLTILKENKTIMSPKTPEIYVVFDRENKQIIFYDHTKLGNDIFPEDGYEVIYKI